jgi:hypothetical protein
LNTFMEPFIIETVFHTLSTLCILNDHVTEQKYRAIRF